MPRQEFDILQELMSKKLEKLEFAATDIRNMNLTTDVYVDKFFPFRIMKMVTAYLRKTLEADKMVIIDKEERKNMIELYRHLTTQESENKINANFKKQMLALQVKLKDEFPNFDWTKQQPKKNYCISDYTELD
jgi:hypothetical protein